ncbi:hypothetical protein RRSWK_02590 [Rhodopirellula sp. SWK7]|nr:hypothetical protein RRSWK_02590 [Rhodopirellula sp. SWK7]
MDLTKLATITTGIPTMAIRLRALMVTRMKLIPNSLVRNRLVRVHMDRTNPAMKLIAISLPINETTTFRRC